MKTLYQSLVVLTLTAPAIGTAYVGSDVAAEVVEGEIPSRGWVLDYSIDTDAAEMTIEVRPAVPGRLGSPRATFDDGTISATQVRNRDGSYTTSGSVDPEVTSYCNFQRCVAIGIDDDYCLDEILNPIHCVGKWYCSLYIDGGCYEWKFECSTEACIHVPGGGGPAEPFPEWDLNAWHCVDPQCF